MKVKLNLFERLTLMGILPQEGSFITLKVTRDLANNIGIKDEEFKKYEIKQESEQVKWNEKGNEEIEFELGEKATDIIVEALKKKSDDKKLTQQQFTLYEKFIGE